MTTLFLSIVVVVTGLVGALVHSTYKWGYYTFGVAALIYLWYVSWFFLTSRRMLTTSYRGLVERVSARGHRPDDCKHRVLLHGI